MDYHIIGLIRFLVILLATTCIKHINLTEASQKLDTSHVIDGFPGVSKNQLERYEYAGYKAYADRGFLGVQGNLNLWSPNTTQGEFSSATISVGSFRLGQAIDLMAGWMVNPTVFGDAHPRYFASYTVDNYGNVTKCYIFNQRCPGFIVGRRKSRYFADAITKISINLGQQYEVAFKIVQDPGNKNWLLWIGGTQVGYWKANLTSLLEAGANCVGWGGLVFRPNRSHPPSDMGSGKFPEEGHSKASYIDVFYIDKNYFTLYPLNMHPLVTNNTLYRVSQPFSRTPLAGPISFYYGGSGHPS